MLWSPIYLIFNLTAPLLCFVEAVQDHLCRDLIFIKKKNQAIGRAKHFKGSAITAHNPRTLSNQRDTGRNCQVHIRKRSTLHIPGKAWEGIAAKRGTQARSSSNVNCKNNSSDCKLAHRVGLTYSLKSLGQLVRQSNSQKGEKVADMEPRGRNTSCKAQNRDRDLAVHCFPGASPQCAYLCRAALPSQEVLLAEEGTVQCTLGWRT